MPDIPGAPDYAEPTLWMREGSKVGSLTAHLDIPTTVGWGSDLHDWLVRIHAAWRPATTALPRFSVAAMERLLLQRWPLNLRALERLVRELTTRCQGRLVEPCDLPYWLEAPPPESMPVDIISADQLSKITAGIKSGKKENPKPLVEKVAEATPVDDNVGKIDDKKQIDTATAPQPPPKPV